MSEKQKILEKSNEELRGWIIHQMNIIENQIDVIITNHYNPANRKDFLEILLNSSIINIGGKFKILRNIDSFDKNIINNLHKISSIRNYFAHSDIIGGFGISYTYAGHSQNLENPKRICYMTSNGALSVKTLEELITEFCDLHKKILEDMKK